MRGAQPHDSTTTTPMKSSSFPGRDLGRAGWASNEIRFPSHWARRVGGIFGLGLWLTFLLLATPWASGQITSTNPITGAISVAGERDLYTFTLTNRARYYFDALSNIS